MRPKLTYANVVATLALFIALGGASYAALKLPKNSVASKQLKKNAVTTAKIKNQAVTAAKVKTGTLTGTQINASTLGTVSNAAHAGTADTANAVAASEPFHEVGAPGEPKFQNGWANSGDVNLLSSAGFYRDPLGIVHLKGVISAATDETVAFTLPPGFRPPRELLLPMAGDAGAKAVPAELSIEANGNVVPRCATVTCNDAGLDGLTFRLP